jgi:anaerobic magnesium-protoporphyrin IX monomethyl ester cyclase
MIKIAFLQNIWNDIFGAMWISSVLKNNGHMTETFICGYKEVPRSLKHFSPHIVGFSVTTGLHVWAIQMAQLIKKEINCLVVLGGAHPTFFPEVIENDCIDIVCRGEGEYALLELANHLDQDKDIRNIKNLWVKQEGCLYKNELRPLIRDLDELPFPDRTYYSRYSALAKRELGYFICGRGCPYRCTFCFNHPLKSMYFDKGVYVRHRSPENVINELEEVRNKWGIKRVNFHDDTFILDKAWLETFLSVYGKEIKLPFSCNVRVDLIDEEMIIMLKSAGCQNVGFGIESGNDFIRNTVLAKDISQEDIEKTAGLLKKYKIKFRTYNMLGLPNESLEDAYKTIELNRIIKTDFASCSLFNPYPMTELGEKAKKDGLVKEGFNVNKISKIYYLGSVMKHKDINKLVNLQKFFHIAVRYPFLDPLIRQLIRLPVNTIFIWIGLVTFGYVQIFKFQKIKFREAITLGILSVKTKSFTDPR